MHEPPDRFEIRVHVSPADIDILGHVNNVVYLRWVQDAAIAHWRALTSSDERASLIWVVTRHEIDYKRQAFLNDEIVVRTWVGTAGRRAFDRHTEIIRASDQRVLATARTVWCPIDASTGRPTDVNADVRRKFSIPGASDTT